MKLYNILDSQIESLICLRLSSSLTKITLICQKSSNLSTLCEYVGSNLSNY